MTRSRSFPSQPVHFQQLLSFSTGESSRISVLAPCPAAVSSLSLESLSLLLSGTLPPNNCLDLILVRHNPDEQHESVLFLCPRSAADFNRTRPARSHLTHASQADVIRTLEYVRPTTRYHFLDERVVLCLVFFPFSVVFAHRLCQSRIPCWFTAASSARYRGPG